jgi:CRP/FNR family transcriptional regulator, anaerobic regulatory protein
MKLSDILVNDYKLSPEANLYISNNSTQQQIAKNTVLFTKGQSCNCIYFIETGLARGFYDNGGQDTTTWFVQGGEFVYSSYDFLHLKPATESVQLLEISTIVSIPLATLNYVYNSYPETKAIGHQIIAQYTQLYNDLVGSFRHQTTDQRLHSFMAAYPAIFERVQKQHIASYLGMCREALSHALSKKSKN